MAPTSSFLVGSKVRQPYLNRYTKFFFTELQKGYQSPYILLLSGAFFSYLAWRLAEVYIAPRQEMLARRRPIQRVPLSDSHNAFWGFADPADREAVQEAEAGRNLYSPLGDDAAQEAEMRRPQLIFSEVSELSGPTQYQQQPTSMTTEVDVVCLELPEYDAALRDDVYYRSVHYVEGVVPSSSSAASSDASASGVQTTFGNLSSPSLASDDQTARDVDRSSGDYLQRMPAHGEEVVHGIIKCKGVTTQNNCVPYAGHLEEEYARKLMLSLGPVHILGDAAKKTLPMRFTYSKQIPVETLVLGLHSGELPRWLSTCYPNFKVDVVEKDGTLIRLCKRFLGLQESNNLTIHLSDPVEYVKQLGMMAAIADAGKGSGGIFGNMGSQDRHGQSGKQYDLVLIDAVDGAGSLSTQYGRLEYLNHLRNIMSGNGCVAMRVPNQDASFVYNLVQNWRMAFSGRPVVLVHCMTSPSTILLTFQDTTERGKAKMGSVATVAEFQDILRAHVRHYGIDRMKFDLTREVDEHNFRVLDPDQRYDMEAFLPRGHPALVEAQRRMREVSKRPSSWGSWLRHAAGSYLTPTQRIEMDVRKA